MGRLRYPRPDDPYYVLSNETETWRFTSKMWALDSYNAGLRWSQVLWEVANPELLDKPRRPHKETPENRIRLAEAEFLCVVTTKPTIPRPPNRIRQSAASLP